MGQQVIGNMGAFAMIANNPHFRELHRALGHALARWQHVESAMYVVAHCLMETRHDIASAVFFHIESARSKLNLTNKLCKIGLAQDAYQRHWVPLKKQLGDAIEVRNALAHFDTAALDPKALTGEQAIETAYPVILSPNFIDDSAVAANGVKSLRVEDIQEAAAEFLQLARALLELAALQIPDWPQRSRSLPPELQHLLSSIQSGNDSAG